MQSLEIPRREAATGCNVTLPPRAERPPEASSNESCETLPGIGVTRHERELHPP
jgi:hypothetical protein